MTPDEYWDGDADLMKAYRKAHEIKTQRRNQELWLQGRYIYDALLAASPLFRTNFKGGMIKPEPYTAEPYPVTEADRRALEEKRRAKEEAELKAQFEQFVKGLRINQEGNNGRADN